MPNERLPIERLVYTISEAAEALGVSNRTMYQLVRDGTIPARRLNKTWIVPIAALKRYLEGSDQDS